MHSRLMAGGPGVAGRGEKPQLRVTVIYEDLSTGLRAKRMFEQVGRLLDFEADFELTLWRADILPLSGLSQESAREAKETDILFLSGHGQRDLPAPVKRWFLNWLANRVGEPSALAVCFDASVQDIPGITATLNVLGSAAGLAGVDVLVHRYEKPSGKEGFTIEEAQSHTQNLTGAREGPLPQLAPPSFQHWGINE